MKIRFMPCDEFDQLMLDWLEWVTRSKEGVLIFHSIYLFMLKNNGVCPFDARKIAKFSNVNVESVCGLMQPFWDKKIFCQVNGGKGLIIDYFQLNRALEHFIQTHTFVDEDKRKVNPLKVDAYYESLTVFLN